MPPEKLRGSACGRRTDWCAAAAAAPVPALPAFMPLIDDREVIPNALAETRVYTRTPSADSRAPRTSSFGGRPVPSVIEPESSSCIVAIVRISVDFPARSEEQPEHPGRIVSASLQALTPWSSLERPGIGVE